MLFSPDPPSPYFSNTLIGHSPIAERKFFHPLSSILFLYICHVAYKQCSISERFVNHSISGCCLNELPSFHEQACRSKAGRKIMTTFVLWHSLQL